MDKLDTLQTEEKYFTQEQVNEIIANRINKEKSKLEKEYVAKLEEEKAKAKSLVEMDAEQQDLEEVTDRIQELEERENQIKLHEKRMEAAAVLKNRGLSESLVNLVIGQDNETTLANINALEKEFKKAVKLRADELFPEIEPTTIKNEKRVQLTKKQFKALPLSKQNELYKKNPELYKGYYK